MHRTDRPSVEAVSAALADPENPVGRAFSGEAVEEATIHCIAVVLSHSELSDEALIALVDGDEGFDSTPEDEAAVRGAAAAIAGCFTDSGRTAP